MGMSNKTEAEIVTVTRASTKWVFDATGTLVEVPVDQLAHDYDPATGEYRGVLIEESRTNLSVPSSMNGGSWSEAIVGGATALTFTQNYAEGPDGALSAHRIVFGSVTSAGDRSIWRVGTTATTLNNPYTMSVFLRSTSGTPQSIYLHAKGGNTELVEVTDKWQRFTTSRDATDSIYYFGVEANGASLSTSGADILVYGCQLEEGTEPTSYIPTAGAAVTRTADDISRLFDAEYNPQQGTWVADIDAVDANLLRGIGLDGLRLTGKGTLVYRYDESGGAVFIDGAKAFDTPPISRPELLTLGDDRGSVHIRDVRYRPYAFTDGEAQAAAVGAISVDYPFEQGQSLSLGFDVQDYARQSATDALDALRTSDAKNLLSVTRATPKWVFDASGTLVEVPVDQPAYDHDPVTGEALGVLIEESRTNLVAYSDLSLDWTETRTSLSFNQTVSPDGSVNATKVASDLTAANSHKTTTIVGNPASVTDAYTFSAFLKRDGTNAQVELLVDPAITVQIRKFSVLFDLENGVAKAPYESGSPTNTNYGIEDCGNGWYWCFVTTGNPDGTRVDAVVYLSTAPGSTANPTFDGDGTSGIYIWGAQVEQGAFPTSYIPTAGSAVTRASDKVSRSLGAEFNAGGGTVFAEWDTLLSGGDNSTPIFQFYKSSSNRLIMYLDDTTGVAFFGNSDGTQQATGSTAANFNGVANKSALSFKKDAFVLASGGTSVSDTSGELPVGLSTFHVGMSHVAGNALNGHIKRLEYYPHAMTATELEALTA